MAAPYNPPNKNEEFKIRIALEEAARAGSFKVNPTIAVGDFKVVTDSAGPTNLATTPTVSPAGSIWVLISLSADEMNGDIVSIQGIDQTNKKEWSDFAFSIPTTSP